MKTAVTKLRKLVDDASSIYKGATKYAQIQEQKLKQAVEDLTAALDSLDKSEPQSNTTTRIFDELREIKESLRAQDGGQQRSWSQVAAQAPLIYSVAEHRALERSKEAKEKEIIVTIRDQKERNEITGKDQQMLMQKIKEHCPEKVRDAIATVRKTPMGYVIKAKTSEDKQAITNSTEWLQKIAPSAIYRGKTFPIVVHGVPLDNTLNSDQKHTITTILENNGSRISNLEITHIRNLTNRRTNQVYGSVVIETTRSEAANAAIERGLAMDGEIKLCERYMPDSRIRHCTRCQRYGHRATNCKQPQRCAKCGQAHESENCETAPPTKCRNCNGVHPDIPDICRNRREEVARAKKAAEKTPYLYEKEIIHNQPRPSQNQSQQIANDWTRVERTRRGRPTDLERAGADPRQTRLQNAGEKRTRDSPTPPPPSPQKVARYRKEIVQTVDSEDNMSDD
jgi:hypothetical protein